MRIRKHIIKGRNGWNMLVPVLFICCSLISCSGRQESPMSKFPGISQTGGNARADSLINKLDSLTYKNDWDSLFSITYPLLHTDESGKDTLEILCAAIYNAQYFLFTEDLDSLKSYLDFIQPYKPWFSGMKSPLEGKLYSIEGYYAIKSSNDFPGMVALLMKSYETNMANGYVASSITPLANIVNFYWVRSDIRGMEYARKAYRTVAENSLPDYYRCIACISMAEMLSLSNEPEKALPYADEAESIIVSENYISYIPVISTVKADIYSNLGQSDNAEESYRTALSYERYAEPAVVSLICLRYGRLCEEKGLYEKASCLYGKGIRTSIENGNMELRSELFLRLATVEDSLGNGESALENYRKYFASSDMSREWELNDLRMSYQRISHEHEIQSKELALLKANRRTLVIASGLTIFAILCASLIALYGKQRKTYRILVDQYQAYLQKTSDKTAAQSQEGDTALWETIEKMMKEEKIFLRKNLTLESMATEAGTNRTYLSKTVNSFSGKNFNSYVDSYRIREAVRIIEESPKEAVFKQIAEAVGYNSVPVFYKAFSKETGLAPGKYRDELLRRA